MLFLSLMKLQIKVANCKCIDLQRICELIVFGHITKPCQNIALFL